MLEVWPEHTPKHVPGTGVSQNIIQRADLNPISVTVENRLQFLGEPVG